MGRSEMEGRCKRHPEHRQSRGVCPFCLRDRLSQISATSSATTTNASSTSSYYSSGSNPSSSANSPPHQDTKTTRLSLPRRRNPGKSEPLKKSRSLAFAIREHKEELDKGKQKEEGRKEKDKKEEKKKSKGWFWSKLMIGSDWRKKEADRSLSHSRTMKEKSSARWVLF